MFRYETFLLTLSWRFRRKEERHNLLCCLIYLAPSSSGPHQAHVRLAPASSKIDPSRSASKNPTLFFLQILTQTSACFQCVTSPAPCHPVLSRTVMTSEWHLHPLARTGVNTCFNVTPNQPMCWAERFSA